MEDREAEGLALCVCAEVCLEAEGVNGWNEGLDGIEWGPRDWGILSDMASGREDRGGREGGRRGRRERGREGGKEGGKRGRRERRERGREGGREEREEGEEGEREEGVKGRKRVRENN